MNFVDVEDVAAGHLLAAERGRPGERYILGGENLPWPRLIDRVAELSGVRYPIMVLPASIRRLAQIREALGLPGALSAEASNLMGQDWRFSSRRAREELGYESRPLDDTLQATIDWYLELIEAGASWHGASWHVSRNYSEFRDKARSAIASYGCAECPPSCSASTSRTGISSSAGAWGWRTGSSRGRRLSARRTPCCGSSTS